MKDYIQNYDEKTAYSTFDINEGDYKNIDGKFIAKIKLIKKYKTVKLNDKVLFFIGNKNKIIDLLLFRTGYDSAIIMCFFIIFITSGIVYYKYKTSYMLITLLISFISVLKSVIVGKLIIFENLFGIIQKNIFYYDTFAGIINFFLCQLLFYDLFQIKFKKIYVVLYSCIFFLFETIYIFSYNTEMIFLMHLIGSIVIMIMGIKAYFDGKKYSMLMMTSYSIFSGTVVYR
ncbi:MAG: hypothetical protein PWP06_926, partial [Candidatus Marinimicrobia bacterium]|nr:hypothetical protein [Candidatus Neomarinimicrobiota bacterium]